MTLLVLSLLVALILEFDAEARREYRDAAAFRDHFKATVLARASVQAARAVLQQDLLRDKLTGKSYDAPTDLWAFPIKNYAIGDGLLTAQIEDERGKLNLNELAVAGNATARKAKIQRVKRLFELVQVNPDLVDAIADWVDPDDVPEPSGAESQYYQTLRPAYRAANGPLQTLLELRVVKGMTLEIIDKLSKVATVYPEQGESWININTADPLVIQSLDPGITQTIAAEIILSRPFKTAQDLERVTSAAEIMRTLRGTKAYDVKSDVFSARMTLTINEVIQKAATVIQRDPTTGKGSVLYFRVF